MFDYNALVADIRNSQILAEKNKKKLMKKDQRHCKKMIDLFQGDWHVKDIDLVRKKLNKLNYTCVDIGSYVIKKYNRKYCGYLSLFDNDKNILIKKEFIAQSHNKALILCYKYILSL